VLTGARSLVAYPGPEELSRIAVLRAAGAPAGAASRSVLGYEAWWDLPALPKLDLDEPTLRSLVLDVAEHWLRFGADGWRLDVAEEVDIHFWREFRTRVRAVRSDAYLVAEIWRIGPEWLQGDTFDALMDYPLTQAILGFAAQHRLVTGIDLPWEYQGRLMALDGASFWARVEAIRAAYGPEVMTAQLNLLGSHDTPRLRTLCGGDLDAVRLATLLQLTLPGAPCIYYGDEIGMEGYMDPDCRRAFPADPRAWEVEPSGWLADLAALRHDSRALRGGELTLLRAEGAALAYLWHHDSDAYACLLNAGDEPLAWTIDLPFDAGSAEVVPLRSPRGQPEVRLLGRRAMVLEMPARHAGIARVSPV
jgi:neopullulanase